MTTLRILTTAFALLLFIQCEKRFGPIDPPRPQVGSVDANYDATADLNVIFLGNSLTYFNNLPTRVQEIAQMDGVKLSFANVTQANYSFEDHLVQGYVQNVLAAHHYDYLVGQQGPSALPESQEQLKASAITIGGKCNAVNTKFALYGVWPSLARNFDRDNSILSYKNAAIVSDALLCPAGLAWKLAWTKDATLPFYGPDEFHPSMHGTIIAAMVIYAKIKKRSNLDFIDRSKYSWGNEISEEQFAIMKAAALESIVM